MKYALLIYATPGERSASVTQAWLDYVRAVRDSGVFVAAEQLTPADTATSVRVRGDRLLTPADTATSVRVRGDRLLTDGPFMETKEHLLGFFLIDVPDLDTALDWAARTPNAAYGTTEVRPVMSGRPWQTLLD